MKSMKSYLISAIFALTLSSPAWAQMQDLQVTIDVVPANATPDAVTQEIKLPDEAAAPEAKKAAAFGLETANRARELKGELGSGFGKEVSDAARELELLQKMPNIPNIPTIPNVPSK